MINNSFFKKDVYSHIHGKAWVSFSGWKTSTIDGLFVVDVGEDKIPLPRSKAEKTPWRDGYIIEERRHVESYEREVKMVAAHGKALNRFIKKVRAGREYELIFSVDQAFLRRVFLKEIKLHKLPPDGAELSLVFLCEPYKLTRQASSFKLSSGVPLTIDNSGDAEAYPVIDIEGSGQAVIKVGAERLFVVLDGEGRLSIDCDKMEVRDSQGRLKNSALSQGFFPSIPEGSTQVLVTGASATFSVRWRYL